MRNVWFPIKNVKGLYPTFRKYLVCKFYGGFWKVTRYSWVGDKDFITHSTARA